MIKFVITPDPIFNTLKPFLSYPIPKNEQEKFTSENHPGWGEIFNSLIEKEIQLRPCLSNKETVEKAKSIFDTYIYSMIWYGFDVNKAFSGQNIKPLHKAASMGCFITLEALIKNKATVSDYNYGEYGLTPLHFAVLANQVRCAEILIQYGANVNQRKTGKDTYLNHLALPLHYATSPEMCELLVRKDCPVNSTSNSKNHETALHWAVRCGKPETVKKLLELGAKDISLSGETALEVAKKIHEGSSPVWMGEKNPEATEKVFQLLKNHHASIAQI